MALLDPLKDDPLVVKAAENAGKMFVWGVEGELGQGRDGGGMLPRGFKLLTEAGVDDRCQHVDGVVKVLRLSWQRRQRRARSGAIAREGEGANQPLLWNRWRGAIREGPHLVPGGICTTQ